MAIKTYKKGVSTQLSTNFRSVEFDCKGSGCCSSTQIDDKLVEYLQNIRTHFGKPLYITSGYRCETHNKSVGGAVGSRHSKGQAADIYIDGVKPAEIAKYAESIGVLGIGLYETNADGFFVHIDSRTTKSFWYGQKEAHRETFGGKKTTTSQIETPKESVSGKMKYDEKNKPLVCMMTQSTCYKGTSTMTPKGVLWHSTGANNPTIKRYVQPDDNDPNKDELIRLIGKNQYGNDWNHISYQAGLNCWIGKLADGTVATVQTMPWNYKPWGCGAGSKGSCNNGWIQFEICEDNLNNKDYFEKVYKEACEITAYLCKMYNIDPKGTVTMNGVKVPTILCHADSNKLGLGSNHGDVNHWFPKYGKSMETAREDVAKLIAASAPATPAPQPTPTPTPAPAKELYRIRKAWGDAKSQIGAYSSLTNAKLACDKAGAEYSVFNSAGKKVYPDSVVESPKPATPAPAPTPTKKLPRLVCITGSVVNVRTGAGLNYKVRTQVRKNEVYTIIEEQNGWGKLKSGAGWICLEYTKDL